MNIKKRFLFAIVLLIILAVGGEAGLAASVPYKTYTYSYWGDTNQSPNVFLPERILFGENMGVDFLSEPSDMFIDKDRNIYIADTGNHRIVVFSSDFELIRIIDGFEADGNRETFNEPQGIFVSENNDLYIADTKNHRIVRLNQNGELVAIIGVPETEFLPDDFVYNPTALVVDKAERIYVVAENVNLGIIELRNDGHFEGFLGAQKVQKNMVDYMWKRISSEEQRKRIARFVPTEFNNITIDSKGFLYVTSSTVSESEIRSIIRGREKKDKIFPVKRLNISGDDILRRNGYFPPVGEIVFDRATGPSVLIDIDVTDNDSYSVLDMKRNRIFTYDYEGNLLYVFGTEGNVDGAFLYASSIKHSGDNMLVLDKKKGSITVFKKTQYGKILDSALKLYGERKYEESTEAWREILKYNSNMDLAYIYIGKNQYKNEQYNEAMKFFKLANYKDYYSKAYEQYRKDIIAKKMPYIFILITIIILLILAGPAIKKKYFKSEIKVKQAKKYKGKFFDEVMYAFYLIFHPFDGYWDLKHEKRGSKKAAILFIAIAIVLNISKNLYSGFLINDINVRYYNISRDILSFLFILILWCTANWCLTTLMDGEGTFQDIFIATAYGIFPYIIIGIPMLVYSNFILNEEIMFYQMIVNFSMVWSGFLIVCGLMVTHQYSFAKNSITTIFTFAGMGVLIFVSVAVLTLTRKMVTFMSNIATEIMFRL